MEICRLCDREFGSKQSLLQHLKTSSQHAWCERCQKVFHSTQAIHQHLSNSSNHHICGRCGSNAPDFLSKVDLREHLEQKHHCCTACDEFFSSRQGLIEHDIDVHHWCEKCGTYFSSSSNRSSHLPTHEPKLLECLACTRKFRSGSGMLIHLESGSCAGEITRDDVERIALECYQSRRYTTEDDDSQEKFKCPGCGTTFELMSGLFQHVERRDAGRCADEIAPRRSLGKFRRYLRISIERDR